MANLLDILGGGTRGGPAGDAHFDELAHFVELLDVYLSGETGEIVTDLGRRQSLGSVTMTDRPRLVMRPRTASDLSASRIVVRPSAEIHAQTALGREAVAGVQFALHDLVL
jgi:hypothetical protein